MRSWLLMVALFLAPSQASAQVEESLLDTTGVPACAPLKQAPAEWQALRPEGVPIVFRVPPEFNGRPNSYDELTEVRRWTGQHGAQITVQGPIASPADPPLALFRQALPQRPGVPVQGSSAFSPSMACMLQGSDQRFLLVEGAMSDWGRDFGAGVAISHPEGWVIVWLTGPGEDYLTIGGQVAASIQVAR